MKIVQHGTTLEDVIRLMENGKEPWIIDLEYGTKPTTSYKPSIYDPELMTLGNLKNMVDRNGVLVVTFEG